MHDVSPARPYNLRRGALLVLVSAFFFASMAAAVRVAAQEVANAPIVFVRHVLMLLFLVPWLVKEGLEGLRGETCEECGD